MKRVPWASMTCFALLATQVVAGDWPQFRGPGAAGFADGAGHPETWSTTQNVAWKAEVPGRGWSSPIVSGGRVFLTTVTREGDFDEPRKGLYFGGERVKPPAAKHQWLLLCLDAATGKELWRRTAHEGPPANAVHVKNSHASETPVADGERVYAYFGNVGLYCYDYAGKLLWSRQWPPAKTRFSWGHAASPALHDGRLFVVNDNEDKSYLVALDARTGKDLWRAERDEKSNWATPFVWKTPNRTELVTPGTARVRSYDLDGKPLWELRGMSMIAIPTPVTAHGLLYVSSGYVLDKTRPVYAIRPGGQGDITPGEGGVGPHVAWSNQAIGPYNPSPLVYGDYLYVLYDRGLLSCYEAKSGKEVYARERVPGLYTASPWAADGRVYCLNEDGETTVVRAGAKFEVLGKHTMEEMCLATPAVADGSLFLRTQTKLYCLRSAK